MRIKVSSKNSKFLDSIQVNVPAGETVLDVTEEQLNRLKQDSDLKISVESRRVND